MAVNLDEQMKSTWPVSHVRSGIAWRMIGYARLGQEWLPLLGSIVPLEGAIVVGRESTSPSMDFYANQE